MALHVSVTEWHLSAYTDRIGEQTRSGRSQADTAPSNWDCTFPQSHLEDIE